MQLPSLADFARDARSRCLRDRCAHFASFVGELRERSGGDYRIPIDGALDHRIVVRGREMLCFDSNGYLGLQRDPRVVAAVHRALDEVGYGTPSAQLLGGTSRYLEELEETVSAFLGREATVVFPSGYAANIGALTALLGPNDFVAHDRFAHASIADGTRYARPRTRRVFAHGDMNALDRLLEGAKHAPEKLVITDGLFSMHSSIANVPALRRICDRHRALLMIDDAHGLGVLGRSGRGVEEHWNAPGGADILMGTFSKAPGSIGGYVSGSRELVDYLRFFARAGVFTAALPAATCAGITEAFRIMDREPEHRERLWENAKRLSNGLAQLGLRVPSTLSPIVTVLVGDDDVLLRAGIELFARGLKVGVVSYPAVPKRHALLRLSVSSRHTSEEIDRTLDHLGDLGRMLGLPKAKAA